MTVKLRTLRAEIPDFEWRAERKGFSWEYVGTRRDGLRVVVHPEARLVGEDTFESCWVVTSIRGRRSYASFWLENARGGRICRVDEVGV